jgi:hypothetical protein
LKNISDSTDRLQGTYLEKSTKVRSNNSFRLESSCSGNLEHRFADFFGVDDDVEQFMADVQKAVKADDKQWIANNVQYPMVVYLGVNIKQTIKNQSQLILYFDKIFHPAFKKKLLAACTCNLFVNSDGVMLGSGEIWISQKANSTEESYDFVISTINNY